MNKIIPTIIEGSEKFRIVDLVTNLDSYATDRLEAYRWAGYFISLGHEVRLEERDAQGVVLKTWDSRRLVA